MPEPWEQFRIGWDPRDRGRLHALWDEVLDSGRWSEGAMVDRLEGAWAAWAGDGAGAVATASWSGGALAALDWAGVRGEKVLCPSNTFMATPQATLHAGAEPVFVDCNREDLCASFEDFERKLHQHRPKAAWVVHIGGHIAFDVERIAALCRAEGVILLEDCAHAHGAHWNGKRPGTWGDAGVYSLYATKTVTTGEGGVLVSSRPEVLEHARLFRNYGKPDHRVRGLNFRMSEFTAALGIVETERMDQIAERKGEIARTDLDPRYRARVELPEGMVSGYYKYIVFERLERSTGRVYEEPCHRIMNTHDDLPNTDWVAENHSCPPLYYVPEESA
jgi:dTDP-4-amino-4,6-dideoxygalactose transaminase